MPQDRFSDIVREYDQQFAPPKAKPAKPAKLPSFNDLIKEVDGQAGSVPTRREQRRQNITALQDELTATTPQVKPGNTLNVTTGRQYPTPPPPPFQSPVDMRLNAPNEAQKAFDRAAAAVQPAPQTPAPRPKQTLGQMRQQAGRFTPPEQSLQPVTPEQRKQKSEQFITALAEDKIRQQAAAKAKLEEEASRASQSTLGRMGTRFARGAVRGTTQTPFEFVQMVNPDPVVQQTMKRIADDSKEWQSQNLPVDNRNPATLNVFKPEFYSLDNVSKAAIENIPEVLGEMLPQMALARGAGGVARAATAIPRIAPTTAAEFAEQAAAQLAARKGAELAARTAAGGYGAAQQSTQAYQKALDAGMTPEQAARAAAIEAPIGFSEFLGSPGTTGFTRPGTTIRREMREEGLQELGQTAASGLAGKYASGYDANKPLVDIAGESIGGGLLGAATGGIVATPGARLQARQQANQQRATRSAIDQRSAANAAAIAPQPAAQPVTEPPVEPMAAQPQPSAPKTAPIQPQPTQPEGLPRLPARELSAQDKFAQAYGAKEPVENRINTMIGKAETLLGSQNENDRKMGERMMNRALTAIRQTEGYLAEAALPPDAPRPFTAVRDAIEARLKPAPKAPKGLNPEVQKSVDLAKQDAVEAEQAGNYEAAANHWKAAHSSLVAAQREIRRSGNAEQIKAIATDISIADANRRKAMQAARTAQRQANAPTADIPKQVAKNAKNEASFGIAPQPVESAPLLRPDAVQNPEGGIPQMPEPTFTDRLEAATRPFDQIVAETDATLPPTERELPTQPEPQERLAVTKQNASRPLANNEQPAFQPDTADLREVREFAKREPRTDQFTEEPPTAPLARRRAAPQESPEVAALREREALPPIERREAKRQAVPKGMFGKLSESSYKGRPNALVENPQLRRLLGLGEMPAYRLPDAPINPKTGEPYVNPAWTAEAQNTLNALAELAGKERSSQVNFSEGAPHGVTGKPTRSEFGELFGAVTRLARRKGERIDPNLRLAFEETATRARGAQAGWQEFTVDERTENIRQSLYDTFRRGKLDRATDKALRDSFQSVATEYGLSDTQASNLYRQTRDEARSRAERAGSEPGRSATTAPSVAERGERVSGNRGRGESATSGRAAKSIDAQIKQALDASGLTAQEKKAVFDEVAQPTLTYFPDDALAATNRQIAFLQERKAVQGKMRENAAQRKATPVWQMTQAEFLATAPYLHGTSKKNAESINAAGRIATGQPKNYSDPEFGDAVYFAKPDSHFHTKDFSEGNFDLSQKVPVEIKPDAKVLTWRSVEDIEATAKKIGYSSATHLVRDLQSDFETRARDKAYVPDANTLKSVRAKNALRKAGYDIIEVDNPDSLTGSIEWRPDPRYAAMSLSGQQLVALNPDAVQLSSKMHEQSVRKALAEGKSVPAEVLADYPDLQKKPAAKAGKSIDAQIKDIRDLQKFDLIDDKEAKRKIAALEAQRPKIAERREAQPRTRENVENSPEFKRWFGDSKVVDENGKPLVVYHGTGGDFDQFDMSKADNAHTQSTGVPMHFFTNKPEIASTYSAWKKNPSTLPAYVSIKNPLVIEGFSDWTDALSEVIDQLPTYRTEQERKLLELKDEIYQGREDYEPTLAEERQLAAASRAVSDAIQRDVKAYQSLPKKPYGYDGIIIRNVADMTAAEPMGEPESYSPYGDIYAVFSPNQIKSAIGNRGTFDPDSAKITERRSEAMPERYTGRQLFENAQLTFRPARNRPATMVANDWGGAMLNQLLNDTFGITTTDANFTIGAKDAKDLRDYLAEAKDSGIYEPAQVANMDAMLKQMDAAIADAEANQQDVAFVTRRPAEPISATKAKIRHETAHLSQSRIAADLSALTGKNWLDSQPNAADIHKELNRRGYAPETYDYEAAAFVASGDYGVFGMNLDQAAKFLSDYFGAVVEKHGKRALQKFGAIDPKLQPTLEAARRETGTARSSTDGRTNEAAPETPRRIGAASEARGSRDSVLARRRESDTGNVGEASRSPRTRASVENSPEFKRWFGDSKVVDESGKPLVVYHGTDSAFDTFDDARANPNRELGGGHYFSSSPEKANLRKGRQPSGLPRAKVTMPAYLSIKRLLPVGNLDSPHLADYVFQAKTPLEAVASAKKFVADIDAIRQKYKPSWLMDFSYEQAQEVIRDEGRSLEGYQLNEAALQKDVYTRANAFAQAAGYDGIIDAAGSQYVAFSPSQIKSAIGNRGTFDPSSPRISEQRERPRFSFGAVPEGQGQVLASFPANIQTWLGKNKPKEADAPAKPEPVPADWNQQKWAKKAMDALVTRDMPKEDREKFFDFSTKKPERLALLQKYMPSEKDIDALAGVIDRANNAIKNNDGDDLREAVWAARAIVERPATNAEKASALMRAAMFSTPRGRMRDLISNFAEQKLASVARIPGSAADAAFTTLRRMLTGEGERTFLGPRPAEYLKNRAADRAKQWKQTKDVWQGKHVDALEDVLQHREVNFDNKWLDKTTKAVFRAMGAADQWFFVKEYQRAIREQAELAARADVRSGVIAKADRQKQADYYAAAPTTEMKAMAELAAKQMVFRNPNFLSDKVFKPLRENLPPGANFALDIVMPVDRTPTNIILTALEYSPLGAVKLAGQMATGTVKATAKTLRNRKDLPTRQAIKKALDEAFPPEKQRAMSRLFGRTVTGTSAPVALGFALASAGMATGFYDEDDPGEEAERREEGKMPNSVKIGDRWYELGGIAPLGMLIGLGATLHREMHAKALDPEKRYARLAKGFGNMAMELPALESAKQTMKMAKAATGKPSDLGRIAGNIGARFVPGLVSDIGQATPYLRDPYEREVKAPKSGEKDTASLATKAGREFAGEFGARIPGVRRLLPPKMNTLTGKPVETEWSDVIDPFRSRKAVEPGSLSGVKAAQMKFDINSEVRPKIGEPDEIFRQRKQRVESWMSEYGDKLLSHPSYTLLTESQKQAAMESLRRRISNQQNKREPKRDLFGNIESFAPEKVIQSVLKSEATRPKREAGKLWSPPARP